MSLFLKLDSAGRGTNQPTDNFTIQYPNLDITGNWEVALVKLFTWYSYYNITAAIGNNKIKYSHWLSSRLPLIPLNTTSSH